MHQLDNLLNIINSESEAQLPPVESWHPSHISTIDIHINSQGLWFHEGEPFKRDKLVKLFASILRYDEKGYSLVTPAEQLYIQVDDVAFIADVLLSDEHNALTLVSQCGDIIPLDTNTQWELREYDGELIPYILVRHQLWARLARHVFYQLVELAMTQDSYKPTENNSNEQSNIELSFFSSGKFFSLGNY